MIENLFYGPQKTHEVVGVDLEDIILDGPIVPGADAISVHTPVTNNSGVNRLDLLYYNSINRHGEVLSSIVYISDVMLGSEGSEFVYNPTRLLNNSVFEASMVVTGTTKSWLNATVLQTDSLLLDKNSLYSSTSYPKFNAAIDYAPKVSDDNFMYDGWYSLVSVFPLEILSASYSLPGAQS